METLAGLAPPPNEWVDDALTPDTLREPDKDGVTTAPLAVVVAPRDARVITAPLARPQLRPRPLTYEVYTPDDTFRAARVLEDAVALEDAREKRRRRVGLSALAVAVTLSTSLMAIASCDDEAATARVETTSASVTSLPVAPLPPAMKAAALAPAAPPSPETFPPIEAQPPITFAPPLATSTHATPPRRRAPSRPPSKH